jgi:hypothetical protein
MNLSDYGPIAKSAGFTGKGLTIAIAVGWAESKGDPHATGRQGEKGLWQIYPRAHPDWDRGGDLYDSSYNARAAFAISNGGTNWLPWATYKTGIYLLYMPQAEVAAQKIEPVSNVGGSVAQGLTHVPDTSQVGQSGLAALTALPEAFNRIGAWISNPANWTRVAQVAVGGVLLLLALSAISKPVTEPIIKAAGAIK